jgi:hypothetical protein
MCGQAVLAQMPTLAARRWGELGDQRMERTKRGGDADGKEWAASRTSIDAAR